MYRVTHKGWDFKGEWTEFMLTVSLHFWFPATIKDLILAIKFQTINSVRSINLSLKYQRFTPSDSKDIGIRKFELVANTQFLSFFFVKSLNRPFKDHIQDRRRNLILGLSYLKSFKSSSLVSSLVMIIYNWVKTSILVISSPFPWLYISGYSFSRIILSTWK